MTVFFVVSTLITLISLLAIFFLVKEKLPTLKKSILIFTSLASIILLLVKVTDFVALNTPPQFSAEANSEHINARTNPSSIKAWNELGRKYLLEKEYINSYMAYSESEQLDSFVGLGLDAQEAMIERLKWMTGLAEARILAQGGSIDGKSDELIERTLELDSEHPKALWYGGLAAAQKANFVSAQLYWNKLLEQNPPDALRSVVERRLNSVNQLLLAEKDNEDQNWQLKFILNISDELLANYTKNSRVFVSLKQGPEPSAPFIAKAFTVQEMQNSKVISLSMNDRIPGMSNRASVDWDVPMTLSLQWSLQGVAIAADNKRLDVKISRSSLDRVFEYTLE